MTMNVEYINPFIEASIGVIHQTTAIKPSVGNIYLKNTPYGSGNVAVLIGLTGKIQGNVVISLNEALACRITSAMMGGMPIEAFDEIVKSAIAELSNMILGNTATIFSTKNISIDISPPTVLTGENMQLSTGKTVIVCIPLIWENETVIELNVSYTEN